MSSILNPGKSAEPQILVGQSSKSGPVQMVDERDMFGLALWFGIALGLVTLVNFGLLWWAPKFGNPEWEFQVIGQSLDRLPLVIVSMALISYGTIAANSVRGTRAAAIVFALLALWVVSSAVIYAMASLVAFKLVPGNQLSTVRHNVAKNLFVAVVYIILFASMTAQLWRRTRRR